MKEPTPDLYLRGVPVFRQAVGLAEQEEILADLRKLVAKAPLFSPDTPYGKPMSVRMTSAGKYGWYSDRKGFRYERRHPNGSEWPEIPASIMRVWDKFGPSQRKPDCCLINYYAATARMGLHQDKDEASFDWPVVSVSLGDDGLFRVGSVTRGGKTESVWLSSGDVVVLEGECRLAYHGVDRVRAGSSRLLTGGGRINLTMRVVD